MKKNLNNKETEEEFIKEFKQERDFYAWQWLYGLIEFLELENQITDRTAKAAYDYLLSIKHLVEDDE